jgi:5'-nucleotidase
MKSYFIILFSLLFSLLVVAEKEVKIVILHTNDTHSQVEPAENNNLGGYARRLGVINKIRKEEKNVLLVDAGDFSQGTPYFNFYGGKVEAKALQLMKYDAVTFGNHEFDNGIDSLTVLLKTIKIPLINANYDVSETALNGLFEPFKIIKKGGVKFGIFGLGVDLVGLTFDKNIKGLVYKNPIEVANQLSDYLKYEMKCDFIVCLSHLGVNPLDNTPTDYDLIKQSKNIDVVISGHSHVLKVNERVMNAENKPVILSQMQKGGFYLGRIDLTFQKKR